MIRRRAGFSLLEIILVMSLLSAAMTIVSMSLFRATTFNRDLQATMQDELTLSRLSRRLREDAHQALSIEKNAAVESDEMHLTLPDESVVIYRASGNQCERTVTKNGERQHHDVFRCSARISFALEILGSDEDQRFVVRVARDPHSPKLPATNSVTELPPNHLPWVCIEAAVRLPKENKP